MWQLFVIWLFLVVLAFQNGAGSTSDACWSSQQEECLIQATLQQAIIYSESEHDSFVPIVPMNIDCMSNLDDELSALSHEEEKVVATSNVYTTRRFERVQNVTLDGCHTPLRVRTYGFEYLPNCDRITQITVERFYNDILQHLHCPAAGTLQTEVLRFRNNEIATINANSFRNLDHLRELYLTRNSLRYIERSAFDGLHVIELIQLENEPLLAIKDPSLFERTAVVELSMKSLKSITPKFFEQLPESLRQLNIGQTPVVDGAISVINPQQLRNISIIGCSLNAFALDDLQHGSVLYLNLSGNVITDFQVTNVSALETVDLSENKLTHLPLEWLNLLRQLRYIVLRGNLLHTISLTRLLEAVPSAHLVDLRENRLMALTDVRSHIDCDRTRIQIDRNPLSCKWLLDFAHSQPEKFRIFQYNKFISQINVNGLECQVAEVEHLDELTEVKLKRLEASAAAPRQIVNVTNYTLVYGNEWDFKRGQRAEALVIVFMLPLGIALLFVLLYLWVYCERLFHWSYYSRALCCYGGGDGGHATTRLTAERFDVVRQLPPGIVDCNTNTIIGNVNDGYETPLNGIISACNCNNIGEKCRKAHHVTYVAPPPSEQPCIYEEIIDGGGEDADDAAPQLRHMLCTEIHPFYDHLMFVRPDDKDSLPNS